MTSTCTTTEPASTTTEPLSIHLWRQLQGDRVAVLKLRALLMEPDAATAARMRRVFREPTPEACLLWIDLCCWTYRPKLPDGTPIKRAKWPFVLFPFQEDAIRRIWLAVDQGRDLLIEKSRDMGATWLILAVFVWYCQFQSGQEFGVASWKEDFVDKSGNPDALFWKIDYLCRTQPAWVRPQTKHTFLLYRFLGTGSGISGESANEDMFRSGRKRAILPDEFASMGFQEAFCRATSDVTDCRVYNSTPKGRGNVYADIRFGGRTEVISLHWSKHPEKAKGLYRWDAGRPMEKLDASYDYGGRSFTDDRGDAHGYVQDGKLRSPWYDAECWRRASPKDIAENLDIDYLASGQAFFDLDIIAAYRRSEQIGQHSDRGELAFEVETEVQGTQYKVSPAT